MEYIQKKSADSAVEQFLLKAADQEVTLSWDRYEGQLPECGFCEAGLSCRDCLQGPCISHPFKDQNKMGVCGKDRDTLAVQSLLRLILKGTMANLDVLNDFTQAVSGGAIEPKDKKAADRMLKSIQKLIHEGASNGAADLPKDMVEAWTAKNIMPEGIATDLIKASQKLEGGISSVEETLLWTLKCALLGSFAQKMYASLKRAVFGTPGPTKVEVGLGVLGKQGVNILIYGRISPVLKQQIAQKAAEKGINVFGVCTDPMVPPYVFPPVTNYGSQEIPLMTGAVDLIVAGDQSVNPSIKMLAKEYNVKLVSPNSLGRGQDPAGFAGEIIRMAEEANDLRRDIPRDIPEARQTALIGFSGLEIDVKKIAGALDKGTLKGVCVLSGSNNVKFTQDRELVTIVESFLKNDILCISEGEATIGLAKYGYLDPSKEIACGAGLKSFLSSLGAVPAVIDCNGTDFILALGKAGKKPVRSLPIAAYFAEANRSADAAKALAWAAMGVSVYFWPALPVTGGPEVMKALSDYCFENFGGRLNVVTRRIEAPAKAELFLNAIAPKPSMSGKAWQSR